MGGQENPLLTLVSLSIWICNDVKFYVDVALQYCCTHTLQVIAARWGVNDGDLDLSPSIREHLLVLF